MQQEKRAVLIEELKQQLMAQKEEIDRREDKETNLEGKIYATDEDCIAAEKPLTDFDLYASTVVPFPPYKEFGDEFTEFADKMDGEIEYKKPNCTEIVDLDFSMHAFEHLTGVRDRHNLTMSAEVGLHHAVTTVENIELYGHLVYEFLQKNRTSWILFDMAAYYWRIHGNATNAIECVRRALHFSPREYKDVTLINMGNILHLSHMSEEAAIVVHAAVDIAPNNAICHFTLGNIYAVLADYNKSAICFENAVKIQPDFTNAAQRYHAVMCHSKLEKALEAQHISLQRTLTELREYQKQHEYWLRQHEKLLNEQAPPEAHSGLIKVIDTIFRPQELTDIQHKTRKDTRQVTGLKFPPFCCSADMNQRFGLTIFFLIKSQGSNLFDFSSAGQDCFQFEQNGHMVLSCNMRRETYTSAQSQVDLSLNLQLLQAMESKAGKIGQKMAAKQSEHCHRT
ncbi:Tetratricopeptide repeat protein 17 like protein [Argiope bruennichi]|uniref:Tetratricopeptide repeat protein 17 like protein n=1 Tax=Argiope bruennichi TaxID=94029 RepID=A0A8T0E3K7_ARGBR|nr:Tetratricopeptide repeat protein 17 like protein [Argiope bruennichi]